MATHAPGTAEEHLRAAALDRQRMSALAAWTARTLRTQNPRPFGASLVHTLTGRTLVLALNEVRQRRDPSAHAELLAIRLAAKRLNRLSLEGYALYSTCEPCPMCMGVALWSGVERVVFGATIEDVSRHCRQIRIPAAEVAARGNMCCVVEGPVLREECNALFTHPRMLRVLRKRPGHVCGN